MISTRGADVFLNVLEKRQPATVALNRSMELVPLWFIDYTIHTVVRMRHVVCPERPRWLQHAFPERGYGAATLHRGGSVLPRSRKLSS